MTEYERMNPDLEQLLERLQKYSEITYGRGAYELSSKEAALLVKTIRELMNEKHN